MEYMATKLVHSTSATCVLIPVPSNCFSCVAGWTSLRKSSGPVFNALWPPSLAHPVLRMFFSRLESASFGPRIDGFRSGLE
jgi:hypothetical protein